MKYIEGTPFFLEYKEEGKQVILCLFGSEDNPATKWQMDAATALHPRQAQLSDRKMISIFIRFSEIRPYGEVVETMNFIFDRLKAEGWILSRAIEGMPDTGSSIDGLVDTREGMYSGPGEDFPEEPSIHGYNAADGFLVLAEQTGQSPVFSAEEVSQLRQLCEELASTILGITVSLEER